jgi:hypothetical protein
MTKFFQDKNPPRVWDRNLNKVTVVFQNGEFETEDPALIDLLVRVGYRHNGVLPKPEKEPKPADDKPSKPKRMVRKKK